ncbi:MAG: TonB-dependent receptor [Gemmatimonadaceae bacterium]|nr:TonB-dependent receptor [Gemmatimonadaceae bacterium]
MSPWFARPSAALRLFIVVCTLSAGRIAAAAPSLASPTRPRNGPLRDEGVVSGVVRDTVGRSIANVQVIVSGVNRVATTDERGEFTFRGLPAGTYHLDVVRIGYSAEHQVITVPANGPDVRVTITMRVATVRLSSVNVTATPTGADPLNVTQATVQLSGKELQRVLSASIGQTLAGEPGMATRFNGPLASAPVIRGLTGERVLVLQDGDRTGDLSAAAVDHLNAVDPSGADRIEVTRGPASLLYGNSALGGVVNVITSDIPTSIPSRASGFLLGQGESVTPGGVVSAALNLPLGTRVAATVRGGARRFQNMRVGGGEQQDNTSGRTNNATIGLGFVGNHESVGMVYRQSSFEYGLPHPDGDEAIRIDGHRQMLQMQSTFGTHIAAFSAIKVDGTAQWYAHNEIEPTGDIGTRFTLNTQTANATARTQVGRVAGAIGVQGIFRQYAPAGDEAFTPGADNRNIAAFIFQELPLSRAATEEQSARVQLGARVDRFTISTNPTDADHVARFGLAESRVYTNVAASAGLSVPVAKDVSLTANASRGFRAPTVEELFANGFHAAVGTFDEGNRELRPEQSTGLEAGVRAQRAGTFAQFNAYYNLINQYIRPVAMGEQDVDGTLVPLVRYTQDDAHLYGVEGQLETQLAHQLVGGVMGDLTRATLRQGTGDLPFIPAGRLGASLRFDNGRWSAGGEVRRVFDQTRVSGDVLDVPTTAYIMLNASVSWLFTVRGNTVHAFTVRADNVLDERYRDASSRIKSFAYNPGRNLSVVYKLLY